MAIKYTIASHEFCFPTMVLAGTGGEHMYSLVADKDIDNGTIVAKNAWDGMQKYTMKDSTGVAGTILEQADNGHWYVEITNPGDGMLVYQVPMIDEEYNRSFQKTSNFYNEKGDVVRAYRLHEGDVIELSAGHFDGTPAAGKAVTIVSRKYKVAA